MTETKKRPRSTDWPPLLYTDAQQAHSRPTPVTTFRGYTLPRSTLTRTFKGHILQQPFVVSCMEWESDEQQFSSEPTRVSNLIPVLRRITFAPSALLAIFTVAISVYAAKKQYVCACVNKRVKYSLMFVLNIKFEINDSILLTMSLWPAYRNYIFYKNYVF